MKKLALAMAIASTPFMASIAQAADGKPQVYGRINVAFQHVDETDIGGKLDGQTELKSNSSRIGVKGSQKINDDITAIYQLEFRISPDQDKDSKQFEHRNSFVGFKGNFGEVKFGNHDTPLKLIQNKIEMFPGLDGDIKEVALNGENRTKNNFMYTSPKMNGLQAMVSHMSSEEADVDDGFSASLTYSVGDLYLAVAHDINVSDPETNLTRIAAQYTLGDLQLGAIYEMYEDEAANLDGTGYIVSAAYNVAPKWTVKAQYGQGDEMKGAGEEGETMSFGVDYALEKSTRLYAFSTTNTNTVSDQSGTYNGVGVEYRF